MYRLKSLWLLLLLIVVSYPVLAVSVSKKPEGEVLIFPFYSTESGWDTYLNVSSRYTHSVINFKFRAAKSGNVIRSFNVYNINSRAKMSISSTAEGSVIRVEESRCVLTDDGRLGRDGFEIPLSASVGSIEVYAADFDYSPFNCDYILARFDDAGAWRDDTWQTIQPLVGHATLINVEQGLSASYQPTALINTGLQELSSQYPNLVSPSLSDIEGGIDAVANALDAGYQMNNQVVIGGPGNANTNWVFSYPLAGYENYKPFSLQQGDETLYCDSLSNTMDAGYGVVTASDSDVNYGSLTSSGRGNIRVHTESHHALSSCFAVNVMSFGEAGSFLTNPDSDLTFVLNDELAASSSKLSWSPSKRGDRPRPILGFSLTTYKNGTLGGGSTLANYAKLTPHQKYSGFIELVSDAEP